MIASGAGWPAGGPGSGAGWTTGGIGRAGGRTHSGTQQVRPVQPVEAPTDRTGRDSDPRPQDKRADAGGSRALVPVGSARLPVPVGDRQPADGQPADGQPAHDRGGRTDLVPAGRAQVPVPSAPRLTTPLDASVGQAVQRLAADRTVVGWAQDAGMRDDGMRDGGRGSARTAPATAAAASDSYRRQGGLPSMGIESGRIFRLSI